MIVNPNLEIRIPLVKDDEGQKPSIDKAIELISDALRIVTRESKGRPVFFSRAKVVRAPFKTPHVSVRLKVAWARVATLLSNTSPETFVKLGPSSGEDD